MDARAGHIEDGFSISRTLTHVTLLDIFAPSPSSHSCLLTPVLYRGSFYSSQSSLCSSLSSICWTLLLWFS